MLIYGSGRCFFGVKSFLTRLFSPLSLFSAGQQGAWYDPSDFATLYQDSAGTTPVTAVGQPVGRMLDKSGLGNHATQPTAINRPVLQQDGNGKYYLAFNGTNSALNTASIDFTATNKMTVWAGVRKLNDSSSVVYESSLAGVGNTQGTFGLIVNSGFLGASEGTTIATSQTANYLAPSTNVVAVLSSISGPEVTVRINGAQVAQSVATQGTGNYTNQPIYIGSRGGGSLFFSGNIYSLIIRGAATNAAQIASTESYVNSKTGAY